MLWKLDQSAQSMARTVTDPLEVRSLAGGWDSLLDRSHCNRAFGSSTWQIEALADDPAASRVLMAMRGSEVRAVLPLRLSAEGSLIAASPLADYNDIIAEPGDLEACGAILHAIHESGRK